MNQRPSSPPDHATSDFSVPLSNSEQDKKIAAVTQYLASELTKLDYPITRVLWKNEGVAEGRHPFSSDRRDWVGHVWIEFQNGARLPLNRLTAHIADGIATAAGVAVEEIG